MEFKLIDTGYNTHTTNISGLSQESASARAGFNGSSSVSTFDIPNVINVSCGSKLNANNSPDIGTMEITDIETVAFENDTYTLSFIVANDYNPSGFNYNYFVQIQRLKETGTIKAIYPSGTGSMNNIINHLGARYNGSYFSASPLSISVNYLPIQVLDVRFSDDAPKDYIKITLQFQITK